MSEQRFQSVKEAEAFIAKMDEHYLRLINEQRTRAEKAEYGERMAKWVVQGMASVKVTINCEPRIFSEADGLRGLYASMINNVAGHLLEKAKLSFGQHARVSAMHRHIVYLEGHAKSRGLPFTPYQDVGDDKQAARWDWPEVKEQ